MFKSLRAALPTVGKMAAALVCSGVFIQCAAAAEKGAAPRSDGRFDWGGLGWGVGIAVDFDTRGSRVKDARIVNDIVRVDDASTNVGVSFVLEAHYFIRDYMLWVGDRDACRLPRTLNCTELAHGPFVAIEVGNSASPGANNPITGYALGWMVGMRHPSDLAMAKSWNIGVGLRVDPNAKRLGDGFVENQPPPVGEKDVRFKTVPHYGVMIMSSFGF
jgi:hypothetical protein